jgi:hypothetical protein
MRTLAAALIGLTGLSESPSAPTAELQLHLAHLAADEMEGRAPGTDGGDRAARYIASLFEEIGLERLADGSYFQEVPLVGIADGGEASLAVDGEALPPDAYHLSSESETEHIDFAAPVLDAGHGIVCPAAAWNDYDGLEVEGRLVIVRPGLPEGREGRFPGAERGAYARDAHKLSQARSRGARGVIFAVEKRSPDWREQLRLRSLENPLDVVAWIEASRLEGASRIHVLRRQRTRRLSAPNVVGVLPGRDQAAAVLVTAHYDAYGVGPGDESGDTIYNGALDNASGTAALVVLARRFASRGAPPARTLVFIATTAEEQGALGLEHYAANPAVPLADTIGALNLDGVNMIAPTDDFIVFPSEGTATEEILDEIGAEVGMTPTTESWQSGMHFSFDTAALLTRGLVGLTLWQGPSYRLPEDEVPARWARFGRIHTPADEWPGGADSEAIAQHLSLYEAAIDAFLEAPVRLELSSPNPFR